jgi:hypothetical protein
MDDLGSQLKGYTQVTEFEPDVDGEYEEEEVSGSKDTDIQTRDSELSQVFYITTDFREMDPRLLPSITSMNLMVRAFRRPSGS